MKKILIINGPNLQLLGKREPKIYGSESLGDIENRLKNQLDLEKIQLFFFQSNHEGGIVDKIGDVLNTVDGIIINPGAYTHTSIAIRDAISALSVPVIEVHISNIHSRESFRSKSFIAPVVTGQICGLGTYGYDLAIQAMINIIE